MQTYIEIKEDGFIINTFDGKVILKQREMLDGMNITIQPITNKKRKKEIDYVSTNFSYNSQEINIALSNDALLGLTLGTLVFNELNFNFTYTKHYIHDLIDKYYIILLSTYRSSINHRMQSAPFIRINTLNVYLAPKNDFNIEKF